MTTVAPGAARPAGAPGARTATRESARSGVIGLFGAAASGLFGFLLAVVITRGYGTAGSGAFFAAIGVVTVAAAVCTLGAETGLMWALPRRRTGPGGDAARILPVALVPPLVASLVVAVAGVAVADRLAPRLLSSSGAEGQALLRVALAALPVVVAAMLFLAALRCLRSIGSYVGVQFFLLPIARPALVGLIALVSGGLAWGMAGWLVPAAVALIVCAALVGRPLGVGRGAALAPHRADWRSFWGFALPRAASAVIDAGSMWVGVLLTAALASQADAGVFGAVGRYVLAGQLAMQGLRVATSPQLSRLLGQGRREVAAQVHRQLTTWGIVLSWPVYLLLAVFGLAFLRLFGSDFTAGATAMAVLAVAMLVNVAVGNVQSLLLMAGRSGLHLSTSLTGLLVNISLSLLLVGEHGVLGAAVAWGAGIATENIGAAVAARLVIGHRLFSGGMLRAAVLVVAGVGLASGVGVGLGGRGSAGLVITLVLLGAGCAGLVAVPAVRRALPRVIEQVSGRGVHPVAPGDVAGGDEARRTGG